MTAPNRPIPEGSYGTASGTSGLNSLSKMTESSVRQAIRAPVDSAFSKARSNWLLKATADFNRIIAGISQAFNFAFLGQGTPPPDFETVTKTAIDMKAAVEAEIKSTLGRIDELGGEIRKKIGEQDKLIANLQSLQSQLPELQRLAQKGIDDAKAALEAGSASVSSLKSSLEGKLELTQKQVDEAQSKAIVAHDDAIKANTWIAQNQQKMLDTHTAMFAEQGKFNTAQTEINRKFTSTDAEIKKVLDAEFRTRTRVAFGTGTELDSGIRVSGYFSLVRTYGSAGLPNGDGSPIGSGGASGSSDPTSVKRALVLYREGAGEWSGWVLIQAKTSGDATDMFHARIEKDTPNGQVAGTRFVTGGVGYAGLIGFGISYEKVFVQVFPD